MLRRIVLGSAKRNESKSRTGARIDGFMRLQRLAMGRCRGDVPTYRIRAGSVSELTIEAFAYAPFTSATARVR